MDESSYAGLRHELRQHIDTLLTLLAELVRRTESLSPAVHIRLQSGVAELQAQLQAFDDLIEDYLIETGVDTEAQEALTRLIEQVHARQQEVQGQMQRISDAPTEDWDSRLARLEAVWSQLDRTARIAMRELAPRPRPEDDR